MLISRIVLIRISNISDKSCTENQNAILYSIASNSPPHPNRVVYEIMWKNMVEPGRPQRTMKYGAWALHAG
jgi:hypothetical protein